MKKLNFILKLFLNLFLFLFLILNRAQSDAVHFEDLFSDRKNIGGLSCSVTNTKNDGSYEPLEVYEKPNINSKLKNKVNLKISCLQGGGDCICNYLYDAKINFDHEKSFFHVLDQDNKKEYWVLEKSSQAKDILTLATEEKMAEINFKVSSPEIFLDPKLQKKVTKEDLYLIPDQIKNKIKSDLPTDLHELSIEIPDPIEKNKGFVELRPSAKPVTFKKIKIDILELHKVLSSQTNKENQNSDKVIWTVPVLKKIDDQYLIADQNQFKNFIPSYGSDAPGESPRYSWLKINNLKFTYNKSLKKSIPEDLPNWIGIYFTAEKTEKINGSDFTKIRVDLYMVDPLTPSSQSYDVESLGSRIYKLRDIWIKTFDSEGRINFWLTSWPGC